LWSVPWSAQIAQLAEHVLGKDEVAGSNPVLGSRPTSVISDVNKDQQIKPQQPTPAQHG
jgi:hypothetical protein